VTPERVAVTSVRGTAVEHKVRLPLRWLKGFAEVQALAAGLEQRALELATERACCIAYSMTSSARASTSGESAMPNALAVLTLITISILSGCSTGKSAGFAPLRILSM
jgi:hypothetical protein